MIPSYLNIFTNTRDVRESRKKEIFSEVRCIARDVFFKNQ